MFRLSFVLLSRVVYALYTNLPPKLRFWLVSLRLHRFLPLLYCPQHRLRCLLAVRPNLKCQAFRVALILSRRFTCAVEVGERDVGLPLSFTSYPAWVTHLINSAFDPTVVLLPKMHPSSFALE